jgi:hypothetical protein
MPNPRYVKLGHDRHKRAIYEHRLMAEKAYGGPLPGDAVVHHIDGDKKNNRNNNLLICSASYHRWLHNRMSGLYAQEHFSSDHSGCFK